MIHTPHRRGFTLVEMLVVIAILGVLVGLLLPAVQRVRDSARRSSCSNNLRQLAMAMIGHESAFGGFPAGRKGGTTGAAESGFVAILPRIEEQPLFDTLKLTGTAGLWNWSGYWGPDAATQALVREAVKQRPAVFVCPADSVSQPLNTVNVVWHPQYQTPTVAVGAAATASYAMCNGKTELNWFYSSAGRLASGQGNVCGMFEITFNSRSREQVIDGLGKTFLLGETFDTHSSSSDINLWSLAYTLDAPWTNISALRCSLCRPNSRVNKQPCRKDNDPNYMVSTAGSTGRYKGFDSLHPGGLVFVFADGRTEFIDELISLAVYQALSTSSARD
jgi:prepilin-type N-terminal cleavage/methylation domain-containing protein